jgi:hypothetical protein
MGKPSKAALSKAGRTLASDSSSKSTKSKAGSTLGKGGQTVPDMPRTASQGAGHVDARRIRGPGADRSCCRPETQLGPPLAWTPAGRRVRRTH